jgi:hypothetical protein
MLEKSLVLLGNRCWPSMGCNGIIELNFDSLQGKSMRALPEEAYKCSNADNKPFFLLRKPTSW